MKKVIILCLFLLLILSSFYSLFKEERFVVSDKVVFDNIDSITQSDVDYLAEYVNSLWLGDVDVSFNADDFVFDDNLFLFYVAPRFEGRRLGEFWAFGDDMKGVLSSAAVKAREEFSDAEYLEVSVGYDLEKYDLEDEGLRRRLEDNVHRGIYGLYIKYGDVSAFYSPTYILASNRSNERLIDIFCNEHGISEEEFYNKAEMYSFKAIQLFFFLGEDYRGYLAKRGSLLVEMDSVNRESVLDTYYLAGSWLYNNVHEGGRMTYKYWPSSATESTANNAIRQWMATVALIRYGVNEGDEDIIALAEKNIDYNLNDMYFKEGGLGLIYCRDQVKLGAVALAALAIFEHPHREKWREEELSLKRTIDFLWQEDGSLVSFYIPEGDMRFQNFYPGEALLYLAYLYDKERDEEVLYKFMKSFEYYRDWHLLPENRNPAFVPWHTQAYYIMWGVTKDERLKEFIFEMNDWLLSVQQWDDVYYRDTKGRFYDPTRPFGPPHSSATGVYLEGLIDAFLLAKKTGEWERAENYKKAINRGLRSVMQLQFKDDVDMYYVSPSMLKYVKGGIKTTVYNNEIRCDNVQHNFMAILKILDGFKEEDFKVY